MGILPQRERNLLWWLNLGQQYSFTSHECWGTPFQADALTAVADDFDMQNGHRKMKGPLFQQNQRNCWISLVLCWFVGQRPVWLLCCWIACCTWDLHFRHESKLPVCWSQGFNPGHPGMNCFCEDSKSAQTCLNVVAAGYCGYQLGERSTSVWTGSNPHTKIVMVRESGQTVRFHHHLLQHMVKW